MTRRSSIDITDAVRFLGQVSPIQAEAVEVPAAGVEREAVRPRPDAELREECAIGAPKDADPRDRAIGRKEKVAARVDEHAGHARQV